MPSPQTLVYVTLAVVLLLAAWTALVLAKVKEPWFRGVAPTPEPEVVKAPEPEESEDEEDDSDEESDDQAEDDEAEDEASEQAPAPTAESDVKKSDNADVKTP